MCVVSMIMDHYHDKWQPKIVPPKVVPHFIPVPVPSPISQEEVDEFRRLLERAREYDKRNNEPNCELESKRQKVRELAKALGIDVEFV